MAAAPSASAAFSALAIWSSALASPWAAHAAEEAVAAAATSSPVSSAFQARQSQPCMALSEQMSPLMQGIAGSPWRSKVCVWCALQAVEAFAADNGALGVGAFIAAYAVATVFLVPGSVLTLAAGAIYGAQRRAAHTGCSCPELLVMVVRRPFLLTGVCVRCAGPLYGTAVVSAASTTGALAAFTVARTAARPWVERQLEGAPEGRAARDGAAWREAQPATQQAQSA